MAKKVKFIVTNICSGGEYTPRAFKSKKSARKWILECTAENIKNAFSNDENELNNLSDEEVINWAEKHLISFKFAPNYSYIGYSDGTYNLMNLYKLSEL